MAMTDEEIFDLADQYGWMDDFERWNFQPDRLVSFALAMSEKHVQVSDKNRHEFFCPRCGHCCREWVGLTDDEVFNIYKQFDSLQYKSLAKAIEAKLKEKNA
jgi:hypothetical protein